MARKRRSGLLKIYLPNKIPQALSLPVVLVVGILIGHTIAPPSAVYLPIDIPSARACFSPGENCEAIIVSAIERARKEILVQAYSFTSSSIADALVNAKNRGVDTRVLYDSSASKDKHSLIPSLIKKGIPCLIDKVSGLAHNKIMVIDHRTVITGSYNWTKAARDRNSENVLLIRNADLAKEYESQWYKAFERGQ
jgi:phosphatidylserine/phosphatidylglycerophosphate/cardiolipin synthase-like enzyme